jgi:hypothetical protein
MSKLYVNEFAGLANPGNYDGSVPLLPLPPIASYTIIVSAGTSGGPNLNPQTTFIEVSTDTTCSFRVSSTTTVSLNDCRLVANERMIRRVIFNQEPFGPGTYPVLSTQYAIFTTSNV